MRGSDRTRRSDDAIGSVRATGASASPLGGGHPLRAGSFRDRLAVARGRGCDCRERRVFRVGVDRAAGTRRAASHPFRAPVRGGADRRGARRPGNPSRLDRDAGHLHGRSCADARAGPASHQRRLRRAREPRAAGRLPPRSRHRHPHCHGTRRCPWWLSHSRAGGSFDVAVRDHPTHAGAGCNAGRRGRLRVRCVLQRAMARTVGVDSVRRSRPWSPLSLSRSHERGNLHVVRVPGHRADCQRRPPIACTCLSLLSRSPALYR